MEFEVVFYRKADGTRPMDGFLDGLESKMRAKTVRDIRALRSNANLLREPHSKSMGEGLFELRVRQANGAVRVFFFFFAGRRIVVLSGFVKKSQKTPRSELRRALRYKADWEERFGHGRS
ncbi:type II toxin-antitoxin system RelE/ParE family toxin [Rubneribacter badeniensis]|uniref:Type II toxin-antitoxin system RelE/ParE family toxin n=2 Tax=Rubneribacter badeniensis TaxID=2070688 RepID=A0A2K2U8J7_9ACTN|nr:type II toxin-antitoxin system RelE/ParE family toxin [Rubneribacter badeniensis]